MKRRTLGLIGLVAHLTAAGVPAAWLFSTKAAAQSPQAQTRNVPVFEVDPAWPKQPQFKLGDASSFAIDAQDNVWLLHRPREPSDELIEPETEPPTDPRKTGSSASLGAMNSAERRRDWLPRQSTAWRAEAPSGFQNSGALAPRDRARNCDFRHL